ncbi:cytochrome c oxidase subunit II [Pararhizobium haloflavum]|uniref:cytochrome c oxidase subunit II n=1 Tax=Pararhizobium haloflavum TaxID=2037914 RepID=UPI000C1A5CE1|nr:cytochrome c oxidase subunit II [Pararhizobium haloflavum]
MSIGVASDARGRRERRPLKQLFLIAFAVLLSGCAGVQSALDPAGTEAEAVATLFWVMVAGGTLIWIAVMGGFYYATRIKREPHSERAAGRLILWGGAVFPVVVLTLLLAYGLSLMPKLRPWTAVAEEPALRIEVTGEQFWWRVTYHRAGEDPVVAANEIRLPVGERVVFTLKSADVVHSFWIPSLGGKMDMIPGRDNTLTLEATRTGIYRSPCAEFCGSSHALMVFSTVVMEPDAFDDWLAREARPSPGAKADGLDAFLRNGCQACHAITGTEANGVIGPDLSHVGSRDTLGAGILQNEIDSYVALIRRPDVIKPGIRMPGFHGLPDEEIETIARYLKGLE